MKKIISKVILFFVLILIQSMVLYSQWEPEVRLTNNIASSETSFGNSWSVAANGYTVHLVWFDSRNGGYEIYYKRSIDAGITWGNDTRLTTAAEESRYPSIAANGENVYLVWRDGRANSPEIYYKYSTDEGLTWSSDFQLSNNSYNAYPPSLAVSDSVVSVVWCDEVDGNWEIFYRRSSDYGLLWNPVVRLTNSTGYSLFPSVTAGDSLIHVAWHDNCPGNNEIYYLRSQNRGISWDTARRLTDSPWESRYASISASGQYVYLVWNDTRSGNWEVHFKSSTDGGSSWCPDTMISNYGLFSEFPNIYASGQVLHVVWFDIRDNDWEIYYKRSYYWGLVWEEDTRISTGTGDSWFPSVAASGPVVHVMWNDERDGNNEIYYRRDSTGNLVGNNNHITEIPGQFKLGQNYPNPFNPVTHVNFEVAKTAAVRIVVYDELGRQVTELVNRRFSAGTYQAEWNAANFSSGIYYYRLIAGNYSETKKMVLIK